MITKATTELSIASLFRVDICSLHLLPCFCSEMHEVLYTGLEGTIRTSGVGCKMTLP